MTTGLTSAALRAAIGRVRCLRPARATNNPDQ
jgi:hypothetical protein